MEPVDRVLGALESLDRELIALDPNQLGQIESLLARRQSLIADVAVQRLEPGERFRLRQIWENGKGFENRLLLVRASIRTEMQAIHRGSVLARALSTRTERETEAHAVDCSV